MEMDRGRTLAVPSRIELLPPNRARKGRHLCHRYHTHQGKMDWGRVIFNQFHPPGNSLETEQLSLPDVVSYLTRRLRAHPGGNCG